MADCKIQIDFEDGATSLHMGGTTTDLVAGSLAIVNSLYQSLKDAKGGELACLMFKVMLDSGKWFIDESDFERETCDSIEELEKKKRAHKAKKQLADIVELLVQDSDGKEGEQNG